MLLPPGCQSQNFDSGAFSKALTANMENRYQLAQSREHGAFLPHGLPLKSGSGASLYLDRHVAEAGEICQTSFVEARRLRLVGDDGRDNGVVSRPNAPQM